MSMTNPTAAPSVTGPAQPPFWNVPNSLTAARLVLSVVVFALIAYGFFFSALIVFAFAALTDALDGYFARLLNQTTALGRQLDPLVDKVIISGAYIFLLTVEGTGLRPWMVATIVIRELLIQGLRSHLEGQGQAFGAKTAGKVKTLLQCLSISAILLCLAMPSGSGMVGGQALPMLRDVLTWSAVLLTIYSGLGYLASAVPWMLGRVTGPLA